LLYVLPPELGLARPPRNMPLPHLPRSLSIDISIHHLSPKEINPKGRGEPCHTLPGLATLQNLFCHTMCTECWGPKIGNDVGSAPLSGGAWLVRCMHAETRSPRIGYRNEFGRSTSNGIGAARSQNVW